MSQQNEQEYSSFLNKLKQNEDKYMNQIDVKVFCGTYNLNGKHIDESLLSWFCLHENCDVYVLGFQELCELSTSSLISSTDWNEREQYLLDCIKSDLCSRTKTELLAKIRLWGIVLFVYAKKKLAKHITDITCNTIAFGLGNMLGNKGTVGVSMKIYETRICCLCSHLASDTSQLERRNADYRKTCESLQFELISQQQFLDVDSHSVIFWVGDFNYRIDNLTLEDTYKLIKEGNFEKLCEYDQLQKQMTLKRAFLDFQEGKLRFRPTYKFKVKTDSYDIITNSDGRQTVTGRGSSGAKPKLPSWTDRVLWKCSQDSVNMVELKQYSSIHTITISDHKPVYGIFNVKTKQLDEAKYRKYYDAQLKESDRKQNEERPKIVLLSEAEQNFGRLNFYQTKTFEISIKNDGISNASIDTLIHFVNPAKHQFNTDALQFNDNHFSTATPSNSTNVQTPRLLSNHNQSLNTLCNQWFKVKPYKLDSFKPNTIIKVQITIDFNQYNLLRLNSLFHLEDILVIKCLGGNDLFVNIVCDYVPTIIGVSLKALSSFKSATEPLFANADKINSLHIVEDSIRLSEQTIDSLLFEVNKRISSTRVDAAKSKSKFYGQTAQQQTAAVTTSTENTIKDLMKSVQKQIIDIDAYFESGLSESYEEYLNYLITKCSEMQNEAIIEQQHTVEECKEIVLNALTNKDFMTLKSKQFDLEILVDVLRDLLVCLPVALIPYRQYEFCMNAMSNNPNINDSKEIINLLPMSHLRLFNLIIQFLKVYSKNTSDVNYHNIADAMFQILKNKVLNISSSIGSTQAVTNTTAAITNATNNAVLFLKLFIDND